MITETSLVEVFFMQNLIFFTKNMILTAYLFSILNFV